MKLFEVFNTWIGEGEVQCLVIAETPEKAIELARPKFKENGHAGEFPIYPDTYWKQLLTEEICQDTSIEWCGEISG